MLGKLEKIEEEVLEVVDLNKINTVKIVDAAFTFPNKQVPNKSTAIILFRDNKNHPFLIYIDEMDNNILSAIIEKFGGGPVGITTIATAVGEEAGTIEEVYEPFLIQEGYLKRTPRGREATAKAYTHIGKVPPTQTGSLF